MNSLSDKRHDVWLINIHAFSWRHSETVLFYKNKGLYVQWGNEGSFSTKPTRLELKRMNIAQLSNTNKNTTNAFVKQDERSVIAVQWKPTRAYRGKRGNGRVTFWTCIFCFACCLYNETSIPSRQVCWNDRWMMWIHLSVCAANSKICVGPKRSMDDVDTPICLCCEQQHMCWPETIDGCCGYTYLSVLRTATYVLARNVMCLGSISTATQEYASQQTLQSV